MASTPSALVFKSSIRAGGAISGTNNGETITGSNGGAIVDDNLSGRGGDDTIFAFAGNDIIDGGSGNDVMVGGAGNDTYTIDSAFDSIVESAGQGTDFVVAFANFTLSANVENGRLGGAATSLTGNAIANFLDGNASGNVLSGMGGNDAMNGGAGADVLVGGMGQDTLTGGTEADTFDFNSKLESGKTAGTRDIITDFVRGTDHIDLRTIDANSHKHGNQNFHFIGTKAFHHIAGELHIKHAGADVIVSGDTDGNGKADFTILVQHLTALGKGDFIL